MSKKTQDQAPAKPGRPRSEATRLAILKAAREILDEAGPLRVTVEAVASRAGVGKPTIYRYWSNAQELSMTALMDGAPESASEPATAKEAAIEALTAQVASVVHRFASQRGRQAALLMATAETDSELAKAFRNRVILSSRNEGRAFLERAREQGELREDFSIDAALDLIYGPIFYRLLAGHAPLDEAFANEIVALALEGMKAR